jgi:hypothetical protein
MKVLYLLEKIESLRFLLIDLDLVQLSTKVESIKKDRKEYFHYLRHNLWCK